MGGIATEDANDVHESTITCMFPCITPVNAHFCPPLEKGPLRNATNAQTNEKSKGLAGICDMYIVTVSSVSCSSSSPVILSSSDVHFASCMKNVLGALDVRELTEMLERSHDTALEEVESADQGAFG